MRFLRMQRELQRGIGGRAEEKATTTALERETKTWGRSQKVGGPGLITPDCTRVRPSAPKCGRVRPIAPDCGRLRPIARFALAGPVALMTARPTAIASAWQGQLRSLQRENQALSDALEVRQVFFDVTTFVERITNVSSTLRQTEPRSAREQVMPRHDVMMAAA